MPWPVDHTAIERAEAEIGTKLPEVYRVMMMECNAGIVEFPEREARHQGPWFLYSIRDHSSRKGLARTMSDIVTHTRRFREFPTFPLGAIAIGRDGGGSQLVMGPDELLYRWESATGDVSEIGPVDLMIDHRDTGPGARDV